MQSSERLPTLATPSASATQTATSSRSSLRSPDGTLRLRGPIEDRRVRWGDDVIDNEGMGKKKSKVCCIYHRPRAFDESSSEDDSDDSSDSDSEGTCSHRPAKKLKNAYEKMPTRKSHSTIRKPSN